MRSSGTPFMKLGLVSRDDMGGIYLVVLGIGKGNFEGSRGRRRRDCFPKRVELG